MMREKEYDMEVTLMFDGGIKNDLMAYGYIAVDPKKPSSILFSGNGKSGSGTSNIAEYNALIAGINACLNHGVSVVNIKGDSQLVVNQVKGKWKIKTHHLAEKREHVVRLLKGFQSWNINWIPREQNRIADALVNDVFRRTRQCVQSVA